MPKLLTFYWLEENGIQYDELFFGKPNADITIDDRVIKFEDWKKINKEVIIREAKERYVEWIN